MNIFIKLISIWLVLQLFYYDYINSNIRLHYVVNISPDRVFLLLIFILFILNIFRNKLKLSPFDKMDILMILFTILCAGSLIASGANADESHGQNRWVNALFNTTIFPFITYFIMRNIQYNKKDIKDILNVLCAIGIYLSLTAIFEHFRLDTLVWPQYIMNPSIGTQWGRARGPFVESAAMGRSLSLILICGAIVTSYSKGFKKILVYLLIIISVIAIYFTYTRAPWLGFGASMLIIVLFANKLRPQVVSIILIVIFVFLLGLTSKFSFFEGTIFTKRESTVNDRIVNYIIAIKMAEANPILGVGYGNFNAKWEDYYQDIDGIPFTSFDGNHNTYLGILAEVGIIGFIVYVLIFYYMIKMCFYEYNKSKHADDFRRELAIGVIAMTASYLVTGAFADLRFHQFQNNVMFLFFGIIFSLKNSKTDYMIDDIR